MELNRWNVEDGVENDFLLPHNKERVERNPKRGKVFHLTNQIKKKRGGVFQNDRNGAQNWSKSVDQ